MPPPAARRAAIAAVAVAIAGAAACKDRRAQKAPKKAARARVAPPLDVGEIAFAGPEGLRPERDFSRGERPICLLSIRGFVYRHRKVDLAADIRVVDPDGQTVLLERELSLIAGDAPTLRPGLIRAAARLDIPPAATPGRHRVILLVRDKLGGGEAKVETSFTLLGTPPEPAARLVLRQVRIAGDDRLPPGAVVAIALTAAGYDARKDKGRYRVALRATTALFDAGGKLVRRAAPGDLGGSYLFEPRAFPAEVYFEIPRGTPPGRYRVEVRVKDTASGDVADASLPVTVVPERFGIFNVHLHDAGGLPRQSFRLGERAFLRLSVHGFATRSGQADLAVDIGIGGPDGGVYLARKGAQVLRGAASKAAVAAGRFPTEIPIAIPAIAPVGAYKVVVRARDRLAKKTATRQWLFDVRGNPPAPVSTFRITDLVVRLRPDLPPLTGDTFIEGRRYTFTLLIGGVEPPAGAGLIFPVDVRATLRLRRVADGAEVARAEDLFRVSRKLTFRPLRLPLTADFTIPAGLPAGLYDLVVEARDRLGDRVSQLSRRVEVVRSGRIVRITLPESAGMPGATPPGRDGGAPRPTGRTASGPAAGGSGDRPR